MKNAIALALSLATVGAAAADAAAAPLRDQAGSYEVQVLVDGVPAPTYYHNGETYLLGRSGDRYTLRVVNNSGQRVEAVVSVDGRDAVDGRPADYQRKRGYLVPAYGQVDIDGWRISRGQAAAFRFSSVAASYAARTGSARDVGVIGVAVFPERYSPPPRPLYVPTPRRYYGPMDDSASEGYGRAEQRKADEAVPPPASTPAAPKTANKGAGDAYSQRATEESERGRYRPGLGTEFGERVDSQIQEVSFVRQDATRPSAILGVRYNDRAGLLALGVDVYGDGNYYGDTQLRRTADPFPVTDRRYAAPPPGWDWR